MTIEWHHDMDDGHRRSMAMIEDALGTITITMHHPTAHLRRWTLGVAICDNLGNYTSALRESRAKPSDEVVQRIVDVILAAHGWSQGWL